MRSRQRRIRRKEAGMVELVDSVDLGSTAKSVQVRVLLPAPKKNNPNLISVGGWVRIICFLRYENHQNLCIQQGHGLRGAAVSGRQQELHRLNRRGERGGGQLLPTVGAGLPHLQRPAGLCRPRSERRR